MAVKKKTEPIIEEVEVSDVADVEIVEEAVTVEESNQPDKLVKIRLRENHKCFIGGERYFLDKGKTYNVPENVKRILDEEGVLAPL